MAPLASYMKYWMARVTNHGERPLWRGPWLVEPSGAVSTTQFSTIDSTRLEEEYGVEAAKVFSKTYMEDGAFFP